MRVVAASDGDTFSLDLFSLFKNHSSLGTINFLDFPINTFSEVLFMDVQ